jgi:hypothetical protein
MNDGCRGRCCGDSTKLQRLCNDSTNGGAYWEGSVQMKKFCGVVTEEVVNGGAEHGVA